jgi:hypothetical protein
MANVPGQHTAPLDGDGVCGEVEGAVVVEEREQELAHRLVVRECWEVVFNLIIFYIYYLFGFFNTFLCYLY